MWVFAFVSAAMFFPDAVTHAGQFEFKTLIVPLIQVIMLGMGMTLTPADFARVAKMPHGVLVGVTLQYTMMPIMGYTFATLFGLEPEVAAGLILVGSCAGGVASNVIAYIARANVALSVTLTACSTLLAPLTTPLAMKLLAGQYVPIEAGPMMWAIVKMIVAPVVIGLAINRYLHVVAAKLVRILPMVSMLGICAIIAITIGLSRDKLLVIGLALFGASVCHNAVGFTLGYFGARLAGLNRIDARTVGIEVGMQNGGMATGLAFNVLHSEVAALASAVFGPWSAVAGSVLASWWGRSSDNSAAIEITASVKEKACQKDLQPNQRQST
ncbi:bile acid:sodium symporter family protein [Planctomycetales bacterium ZRK34]|nr:bile acid:sodium symporter family protein [Planctomycetales bacterium ZRK34]